MKNFTQNLQIKISQYKNMIPLKSITKKLKSQFFGATVLLIQSIGDSKCSNSFNDNMIPLKFHYIKHKSQFLSKSSIPNVLL